MSNNYIVTRGGQMTIQRILLGIATVTFSTGMNAIALAQEGTASPPPKAQTDGASGRGVRIIAPEDPAPASVAKQQQTPIAAPPVHATKPTSAPAAIAAPAMTASVLKPCDRPLAKPALRFSDPAGFDRRLRSKLRGGRAVAIDMDTPYPVGNEAPAPLGAWLNEIQKSGGAVTVAPYCQKGRGFGDFIARIFGGGPAEPYRAARKYDATLHVDSIDRVVTQVEFTPRRTAR